jgi:hypothetical protein
LNQEERDVIFTVLAKKEISHEGDLINIEDALKDILKDRYECLLEHKWSKRVCDMISEATLESLFRYYAKNVSS